MLRDLILQELEAMPETSLVKVLDFVRAIKTEQLSDSPYVTVISSEGESVVSVESLKSKNIDSILSENVATRPIQQIRQELNTALKKSGYCSKESILELVQEVKKEMLTERESR